jgi:hypothetical protein
MLLELAPALPQPTLPPLVTRHDPLRVKLKRHLLARVWRGLPDPLRTFLALLRPRLLARPAKELAPALRGAQLLGQLITPLIPWISSSASSVALVLAITSRAICSNS